jgi:spermidine synthase
MQGSIRMGDPPIFEEIGPDHTRSVFELKKILYRGESRYQTIDIVDTFDYGRMLILDGCAMVSQRDEANYHEMIAHVPLLIHPSVKRVLIIGGGDGGTVREVLKHNNIEHVDLVEIDKQVVEVCQLYLPSVALELSNPRVRIHYLDGKEYIRAVPQKSYDVILIDSSDPIGPATGLFTADFYKSCKSALTEKGIIVVQSESPYIYPDLLKQVFVLFRSLFPYVKPYKVSVPTYPSGQLYFMLGSVQNPVDNFYETQRSAKFLTEHGNSLKYVSHDLLNSVFAETSEIGYLWK